MTDKKRIYDPIERAKRNPKSLRLAINANCWDCQGRDADPAPRWRIGNCEIPHCPLYPVRPYQSRYGTPMPDYMRPLGSYSAVEDDSEQVEGVAS